MRPGLREVQAELLPLPEWLEYDRAERVDRLIACLGSVLTHR